MQALASCVRWLGESFFSLCEWYTLPCQRSFSLLRARRRREYRVAWRRDVGGLVKKRRAEGRAGKK